MADLLLDSEGDISITNGKITLTKNVSQKVSILLKSFKGEWFLDDSFGIPYFQTILGKKIYKEQIDSIFKTQILNLDGVSKILFYSSTLINRQYQYSVSILSTENKIENIKSIV